MKAYGKKRDGYDSCAEPKNHSRQQRKRERQNAKTSIIEQEHIMDHDETYTIDEVARVIKNEGIGYAITCCLTGDEIENIELKYLWKKAKKALEGIEEILDDQGQDYGKPIMYNLDGREENEM